MVTKHIQEALPPDISRAYSTCLTPDRRSSAELREAAASYVSGLLGRAAADAFLDLKTALRVSAGCERLLDLLEANPSPEAHAAVQAVVDYFILEDDAEADGSVIGFDDDLLVVQETFRALGWDPGSSLS